MKVVSKDEAINEINKFVYTLYQPDVRATFINYFVKIILNPVIVIFIPLFLPENKQGYWYTFNSLAALTMFADLGFSNIMRQYAAHEYTYLDINHEDCVFKGEKKHIERISSQFQFLIRWLCGVLSIAMIIIFFAGIIIFSGRDDGVAWEIPWGLYVFGTIMSFATQVELSFFEGCDQFAVTQKVRIIESVTYCTTTIFMLAMGFGLYALSIPIFAKTAVVFFMMYRKFGGILRQMVNTESRAGIQWAKEVVPLLGKYAVSCMSGYFASHIYNPLIFTMYGAQTAGKVGYSLSIVNAIQNIACVWSVLAIPKYNMAVEKRDWNYMDMMLKRNIIYSIIVYFLGIISLYCVSYIPVLQDIIWSRIMPKMSIGILALGYLFMIISYALSTYLRAHKQEPFMIPSVINGVLSTVLTIVFLEYLGLDYVFMGILVAYIFVLPLSIFIWVKLRIKWHRNYV